MEFVGILLFGLTVIIFIWI